MEAQTEHPVFTIGHSSHSPGALVEILRRHGVTTVADVRSQPYSRYMSHFNREALQQLLEAAGMAYVFLGQELGGRPQDRSFYSDEGRVQYDRIAASDAFDDGIRTVVHLANRGRAALMCTEKEPLDCHRTLLVARELAARGVRVEHILADGGLESHDAAMERLVDEDRKEAALGLYPDGDLFRTKEEVIANALGRRGARAGYRSADRGGGEDPWETAL